MHDVSSLKLSKVSLKFYSQLEPAENWTMPLIDCLTYNILGVKLNFGSGSPWYSSSFSSAAAAWRRKIRRRLKTAPSLKTTEWVLLSLLLRQMECALLLRNQNVSLSHHLGNNFSTRFIQGGPRVQKLLHNWKTQKEAKMIQYQTLDMIRLLFSFSIFQHFFGLLSHPLLTLTLFVQFCRRLNNWEQVFAFALLSCLGKIERSVGDVTTNFLYFFFLLLRTVDFPQDKHPFRHLLCEEGEEKVFSREENLLRAALVPLCHTPWEPVRFTTLWCDLARVVK